MLFFRLIMFITIFYKKLIKLHQEINFDIIHVHDLPLSKTIRIAAKKINIPYVIDLHENYADAMKNLV